MSKNTPLPASQWQPLLYPQKEDQSRYLLSNTSMKLCASSRWKLEKELSKIALRAGLHSRYSAVNWSDYYYLLHIFASNMTTYIQKKPCVLNSKIAEISRNFRIVHGSRASRGNFDHSRSKATVLQRIMYNVTDTKWKLWLCPTKTNRYCK